MKLFLYNHDFDLRGKFAILNGYRLGVDKCNRRPELIEAKKSSVYGRVVDVDEFDLDKLDTFYCIGLGTYSRIEVQVTLKGGKKINAYTYKYNMEVFIYD